MTDQIIPRSMIQAKARDAFARGVERDDHGFNWHCVEAIATWQAAWDRCMEVWDADYQLEVSPP